MLRDRLRGEVVMPPDPGYPLARQLQNTEYDAVEPWAIAYCETHADVSACVRFARERGLQIHPRSGGHSFNGWSTGSGLVVDVSRMNHVEGRGATVRLGAGVQSLDALDALRPLGRQIVTGTFPTVGAAGFLSGGGLGWQTRKFGLGSDQMMAAELVLADGRFVRCSADEEPDLFWALRGGGGGNFGIVTEFEVRTVDAPTLIRYETLWEFDAAARILAAWQEWCVAGPDELGSSLVLLPGQFGPAGDPFLKIWGVHLGVPAELESALDELAERAGVRPFHRTVAAPGPYSDVMHEALCGSQTVSRCHRVGTNPEAEGHRHPYTRQSYRLTDRAVTEAEAEKLIGAWDPSIEAERYLLCIATGGAASRIGRTETAYPHRAAQFLVGYQRASRDGELGAAAATEITAWADRCESVLALLGCGSYINFPSSRAGEDWGREYYGENYDRLLKVKRAYDPDNFFRHARSIGSTPEREAG
ncbi:FAD-binding oxidoreductase [Streptomyces kronopolitis]|uniref:FAD-binding oxidoreductase n=1 Tax=Streptomyces kronopolitis TaxID=1612435 RepID=UPI0034135D77